MGQVSGESVRRARAEGVLAEALARWDAGAGPAALRELAAAHPDLADELAALYPDWVAFGERLLGAGVRESAGTLAPARGRSSQALGEGSRSGQRSAESLSDDSLRDKSLRGDSLRDDSLREDPLRGDSLPDEALRGETPRAGGRGAHAPGARVALGRRVLVAGLVLAGVVALALVRGRAREPYILFAAAGGGQIAAEPLYLGPERRSVVLTFDVPGEAARDMRDMRDTRDIDAAELRLVSAASGAPLAGWSARWVSPREVELVSPADLDGFLREEVRLEPVGGEVVFAPFTLVFLGRDAWSLASFAFGEREVAGTERSAVDPAELELSVRLAGGGRGDVAQVEVRSGRGEPLRMKPVVAAADPTDSDGRRFALPLAELGLKPGPAELAFTLQDGAGRELERRLELEVVKTPLRSFVAELVGSAEAAGAEPLRLPRSGARVFLVPGDRPLFALELERPAELAWRVEVEGELEPLARGRVEARSAHTVDLAPLCVAWGARELRGQIAFVADENERVARSDPARGRVEGALPFAFGPARIELDCELTGELASSASELTDGAVELTDGARVFTDGRGAALRVRPRGALTVPARVFARLEGRDGVLVQEAAFDLGAGAHVLPLALGREGELVLALQAFRVDTATGEPIDAPDVRARFRIAVAAGGARVELQGAPERAEWTTDAELVFEAVVVQARASESAHAASAPVAALECSVRDPTGASVASFAVAGPPFSVRVPKIEEDGAFELEVGGRDAAGNALAPARLVLDVARHGPALELASPRAGATWEREHDGSFSVALRARDPNGLALVDLTLTEALAEPRPDGQRPDGPRAAGARVDGVAAREIGVLLTPAADGEPGEPGDLRGRVELPDEWEAAELRLSAVDRFANASELRTAVALAPRSPHALHPARVAVRMGEVPVEALCFVAGNSGAPYVFGGRSDALENELFAAAGLAPFSRGDAAHAWAVELAPGAIEDFYLDEREVTCEAFLQFLVADDGYVDPAHWPAGSPAGAAADRPRMAHLLARLRPRPPAFPATGVTWEEACAYASWVEKRLPSLVEWEYAVRGGNRYRPCAAWSGAGGRPAPAGARALVAAGASADVSADTRLFELCTNAAEWTATPWGFRAGAEGDARDGRERLRALGRDAAAVLRAPAVSAREFGASDVARASSFWIAGGSFERPLADFAALDDRPRGWSGESVGFRCALSAREAERRLRAGGAGARTTLQVAGGER